MVVILRTRRVEKSLLEIYRFIVSRDISGVLEMQFGELKLRFMPTASIHIVWYIRNIFDCLDVSKCFFHLKYDLHSCSSYLFQKLLPPKFRSTYSTVVGHIFLFLICEDGTYLVDLKCRLKATGNLPV
jgi:hypothetical protein